MKKFLLLGALLAICIIPLFYTMAYANTQKTNMRDAFISKNGVSNNTQKSSSKRGNIVKNTSAHSSNNTNIVKKFFSSLQIFKSSKIPLEAYSGLWVEVAKKNTRYSSVCYMVFAQYTLNPNNTFTLNTYCVDKAEENILTTQSTSKPIDKFNTTFEVNNKSRLLRMMVGTIVYKIYYINPDQSIIIVGTLDKRFLSILSRDELSSEQTKEMLNKAVSFGFNVDNIELTDTNAEKFALYSSQVGY